DKAEEVDADAIGLSGLLVKSTVVMREDLEELNARELFHYPVLLGGAALTRRYVEHDLRDIYKGTVVYCQDAFEGLATMDRLTRPGDVAEPVGAATRTATKEDTGYDEVRVTTPPVGRKPARPEGGPTDQDFAISDVREAGPVPVPQPPFW